MSEMAQQTFEIVNELGLHARAAATLVRLTARFNSAVDITKDDQTVNGKSILGMMTLAAGMGSTVHVECRGDDAQIALDAIGALIADKFGEGR